jgi:glycogenin glucosyltransferase
VGELASLHISSPSWPGYSKEQLEDQHRQYEWERGNIDYLGIDAFAHIKEKLDETIKK